MSTRARTVALAGIFTALALPVARAQSQIVAAPAAQIPAGPAINDVAPDFALPGGTRYGVLKAPVRLSDFRGRTVVLAFFYQARTKG